jgi:3'-phosphoadenosine 5'-phosphosulfate sulfotransferase (PAPS reductase)/FAD synthetase
MGQLALEFELSIERRATDIKRINLFPLDVYDKIIISESGGKDSMACLFYLLDLGIPPDRIELWHQSVDGGGDQYADFLDWPVTEAYIEAVSRYFGVKTTFQWRAFGIKGELLRKESRTGDVYYVQDGNIIYLPTKQGKEATRLKWPAMSPDLRVRWCSAYVKIDVFRRVLNNDPRFQGTKDDPMRLLVITGERREESPNRARYAETEEHTCSNYGRIVHAWRPVIDWDEADIWEHYERRRFLPHPAYLLGWNRTSCFGCIFSTPDLWAMMREIAPERFYELVRMERELNHTIDPKMNLEQKANRGSIDRLPKGARTSEWVRMALTRGFDEKDLIMDKWELPAGAFRGGVGGPS